MKENLQFLCNLPLYQEEQPFELYGFPDKQPNVRTNCEFESKDVNVADARLTDGITIATHGFTFVNHKSACPLEAKYFETVGGDDAVTKRYLEETIGLVKDMFSPVDVICFDWRFRRRDPKATGRIPPRALKDIRNFALPTGDVVHCDYSATGGYDRLKMQLLPEELNKFHTNQREAMIVNVWRPLNDRVQNTPLLLCDRRTVPKHDLIEVDKVLSDKVEKAYFLFHQDYHRWFYFSEQRSDEVAIFPTWSSRTSQDFADCSPHGAGASIDDGLANPRESVEVRLLVILDGNSTTDGEIGCEKI